MNVTLTCCRCGRTDLFEVFTVFDLLRAAAAHGWRLETTGLKGGRVTALDICPDHPNTSAGEVRHAGAGTRLHPGVGALKDKSAARPGAAEREDVR